MLHIDTMLHVQNCQCHKRTSTSPLFTKVFKVLAKNIHLLPTQQPDFTSEYRIELIDADRRFGRRSYDCIAPYITRIRIWRVVFKTVGRWTLDSNLFDCSNFEIGEWWLVCAFGLIFGPEIASGKYVDLYFIFRKMNALNWVWFTLSDCAISFSQQIELNSQFKVFLIHDLYISSRIENTKPSMCRMWVYIVVNILSLWNTFSLYWTNFPFFSVEFNQAIPNSKYSKKTPKMLTFVYGNSIIN